MEVMTTPTHFGGQHLKTAKVPGLPIWHVVTTNRVSGYHKSDQNRRLPYFPRT